MFGSPRQALAYMYAAKRGPTMAKPRWDTQPKGTGRSPWDHVEIATLLYGPKAQGCCGVTRGSALDRELHTWAMTHGHPRSREVEAVEKRLRRRMREHGLQPEHRRPKVARLLFLGLDPHTGIEREHDHLVEAHALHT